MLSSCDCNCHNNQSPSQIPKRSITYPNNKLISKNKLNSENICLDDYSELEAKFIQLENDIQNLSEKKLELEYELRQKDKQDNELISELQIQNENLMNEINERNLMIEDLYKNNNNIYLF